MVSVQSTERVEAIYSLLKDSELKGEGFNLRSVENPSHKAINLVFMFAMALSRHLRDFESISSPEVNGEREINGERETPELDGERETPKLDGERETTVREKRRGEGEKLMVEKKIRSWFYVGMA
ncbi:hypothetical protein YC2023_023073 [Brassica napus]